MKIKKTMLIMVVIALVLFVATCKSNILPVKKLQAQKITNLGMPNEAREELIKILDNTP